MSRLSYHNEVAASACAHFEWRFIKCTVRGSALHKMQERILKDCLVDLQARISQTVEVEESFLRQLPAVSPPTTNTFFNHIERQIMKPRDVAKVVGALQAALECSIAQLTAFRQFLYDPVTGPCGVGFCDFTVHGKLLDISGVCTHYFMTGKEYHLRALKEYPKGLAEALAVVEREHRQSRDDYETMRHAQLGFLLEAMRVTTRRLENCLYCLNLQTE